MNRTEEALNTAQQLLANWLWSAEAQRPESNRLDVYPKNLEDLIPMVVGLRVQRLGYLATITCLDQGSEVNQLELLYHFCTAAAVITLRVRVPRDAPVVPSLAEIIPSSEAFEREVSEMFGVTFKGIRNPDRLYLPDEWPEGFFPLRKDISLQDIQERLNKETVHGD
jgi:Ni,Fe-hydrogenase III component G